MNAIHEVIEQYFESWNRAFESKNGEEIRGYFSESFVGYWGNSEVEQPMVYDRDYDLETVLAQYGDARKSFEPVSITERKTDEEYLVMGTETNVVNGVPHPAKCMFVWQKENGSLKLRREFIELEK